MPQKKDESLTQAAKKKVQSLGVRIYLFAYNALQTVGWSVLLWQLLGYYLISQNAEKSLYETVKWSLIIFQNAAILEIVHAAIGIVPSNPFITTQQVFSRVMLVCGVIMPTVAAKQTIGLPLALYAWCITEIIRYSYYALNLIGCVPSCLIWLRYNTFIILYPIGVLGELLCLYAAQQELAKSGLWNIQMPNFFNFIFNYRYFLILVMLLYIPFFPQLYLHMFKLRRKILGGHMKTL